VNQKSGINQTASFLLVIGLVIAILVAGRTFLIPIAIAMLFSFLLLPVSRFMENHGLHRVLAILVSLLLAVVVLTGIGYFMYHQVANFADDGPQLKKELNEKIEDIQKYVYRNYQVSHGEQKKWINEQTDLLLDSSGQYLSGIFAFTGNLVASITLMPIYIFFMTLYRDKIKVFLCKVTPTVQNDHILSVAHKTAEVSYKYIRGLFIDIAILAVLNSVGFLILGIDYAILLGILVAVLNVVPYIGVIIGSIIPFAIALLTGESSAVAFGTIGVCIAVQFVDNNFLTPKIVGSSVSINPLATLLSIILGGMLWGIAGMMLFIPLLGMAKVICDSFPATQPFGYLIGEEAKMKSARRKKDPTKLVQLNG